MSKCGMRLKEVDEVVLRGWKVLRLRKGWDLTETKESYGI